MLQSYCLFHPQTKIFQNQLLSQTKQMNFLLSLQQKYQDMPNLNEISKTHLQMLERETWDNKLTCALTNKQLTLLTNVHRARPRLRAAGWDRTNHHREHAAPTPGTGATRPQTGVMHDFPLVG